MSGQVWWMFEKGLSGQSYSELHQCSRVSCLHKYKLTLTYFILRNLHWKTHIPNPVFPKYLLISSFFEIKFMLKAQYNRKTRVYRKLLNVTQRQMMFAHVGMFFGKWTHTQYVIKSQQEKLFLDSKWEGGQVTKLKLYVASRPGCSILEKKCLRKKPVHTK